jgi:hypothetical protein
MKKLSACAFLFIFSISCWLNASSVWPDIYKRAEEAAKLGNDRDAFLLYKKILVGSSDKNIQYDQALKNGFKAMNRAGLTYRFDNFTKEVLKVRSNDIKVLLAAAECQLDVVHYGYIIAGEFQRGYHRGGGERVSAMERDRTKALKLLFAALPAVESMKNSPTKLQLYTDLCRALRIGRMGNESWRLQRLTDLKENPNYQKLSYGWGRQRWLGAPVDMQGNPIYYKLPEGFAQAVNDGERWRYALRKAEENGYGNANWDFAHFLYGQFGVQTLGGYLYNNRFMSITTGPYAVQLLKDDETIARLADGVKKIKLPEEFNYIRLFHNIIDKKQPLASRAVDLLVEIYKNRRQYDKAAEILEKNINKNKYRKKQLAQIIGNWGTFPGESAFAAGEEPKIKFKYRNAQKVVFSLYSLNVAKYIQDIKGLLKSSGGRKMLFKLGMQPQDIGKWLLSERGNKYITRKLTEWTEKLKPSPGHFDRIEEFRVPVSKGGAYLLEANVEDGNVARIIVWLNDLAIIQRSSGGERLLVVTDAASGKPEKECEIKMFGYRTKYIQDPEKRKAQGDKYEILIDNFNVKTDSNGLCILNDDRFKSGFYYMIEAAKDLRHGVMGFKYFYHSSAFDTVQNVRQRAYCITDRPVYRPGQKVHFKYWIRQVGYGISDYSDKFADKKIKVIIQSSRGNKVLEKEYETDSFAAFDGEFELNANADLGRYSIYIEGIGGYAGFRVEEYRKPEYEVKVVLPDKPAMLGNKIKAQVNAQYYFGAPVAGAEVKYKVYRRSAPAIEPWPSPWRWLYGKNAVFAAGCLPSTTVIGFYPSQPPELALDNRGKTDEQGNFALEIDTALAQKLFGDQDSEYEIVAEVVDISKYTVTGKGKIIAASKPFSVFCMADRGFYDVGAVINMKVVAMTPNNKPVTGKVEINLSKITFNEKHEPVLRIVRNWSTVLSDKGEGEIKFKINEPGHYRFLAKVTDAGKNTVSGENIVRCTGGNKVKLTGLPLEVVTDKLYYKVGDKASIMINSSYENPYLFVFARPAQEPGAPPEVIKVDGTSFSKNVLLKKADMPNSFIEIWMVRYGKLYRVQKELLLPPEKKVLNVQIAPNSKEYKPGTKCELKIKITDINNLPVKGEVVISVYDKAIEYISGGSNVPDIESYFWKWMRHYYSRLYSSLDRKFNNLLKKDEIPMQSLGIFGGLPAPFSARPKGIRGKMDSLMLSKALPEAAATNGGGDAEPIVVRKDFADSAFWKAKVTTNSKGEAKLDFKLPDNLTAWKIKVWTMSKDCKVGQGEAEVVVSKDFLVRLEIPRFLIAGDRAEIAAIVHNRLSKEHKASISLDIKGQGLQLVDKNAKDALVKAQGESKVSWSLRALQPGVSTLTLKAVSGKLSDAVELPLQVFIKGIKKQVPYSGYISPEQEQSSYVALNIPQKRKLESTKLTVQYSPSVALAIVDALPYLVERKEKNTYSVINSFVPTLIVYNTLGKLGVDLKKIKESTFKLNPTELGKKGERSKQWKRYTCNPVFNNEKVAAIVKKGLRDIAGMQNGDGGWGWFSGFSERSWADTTAFVVRALLSTKDNAIEVNTQMLSKGVNWLKAYQDRRITLFRELLQKSKILPVQNLDALVFDTLSMAGIYDNWMAQQLFEQRKQLSLYGLSLCGMAFNRSNDKPKLQIIMQNLDQFVIEDSDNQTAYLRMPKEFCWWFWYDRETETQANYLRLLSEIDPKGKRTAWLAKYLLINRKHSNYWNTVRDTGLCVSALAEFVIKSGENKPDMEVEVLLDGKIQKKTRITSDNMFTCDNTLTLSGQELTTGTHTLEVRRTGKGTLYFNAYLSYFSLEDKIKSAGLDLKVERRFYKLLPANSKELVAGKLRQPLEIHVEKYKRIPLPDLSLVKSGDLVEIELITEAKNDYAYIVLKDAKPAGFEPVELLSGYTGNSLGAFVEFRDRSVQFYVRNLARGKHSLSYRMRAQTPGKFTALPTVCTGVYAPELRGNSDEFVIKIKE